MFWLRRFAAFKLNTNNKYKKRITTIITTITMSTNTTSSDNGDNDMNPCQLVRRTCLEYYEECYKNEIQNTIPMSVRINREAIQRVATEIYQQQKQPVEWDEENWHYNLMKSSSYCSQNIFEWKSAVRFERTAAALLALDGINFCFWPSNDTRFEYEQLATSIRDMSCADHNIQQNNPNTVSDTFQFTAKNLAILTEQEMDELFHKYCPTHTIPNVQQRIIMWNHIGTQLLEHYNGSVTELIQSCNNSAPQLVQLLITTFPKCFGGDYVTIVSPFDDNTTTQREVHFYKRAQICVADLNAALQLQLNDMDKLTMFADYRVPQILYHMNILQYSESLQNSINNYKIFNIGSPEEVAIRAATVTAVEWLVDELNNTLKSINNTAATITSDNNNDGVGDDDNTTTTTTTTKWTPVVTDWYLWQLGERMMNENKLTPHHRVLTIYY